MQNDMQKSMVKNPRERKNGHAANGGVGPLKEFKIHRIHRKRTDQGRGRRGRSPTSDQARSPAEARWRIYIYIYIYIYICICSAPPGVYSWDHHHHHGGGTYFLLRYPVYGSQPFEVGNHIKK